MVLIGGKPTPKCKLLTQMTMTIRIQPLNPPGMNCEYHSGDLYDHYVAPNQSFEDQLDYDQDHSENQEEYNTGNSAHQDTLMYENQDVEDATVDEEPFEDDLQ